MAEPTTLPLRVTSSFSQPDAPGDSPRQPTPVAATRHPVAASTNGKAIPIPVRVEPDPVAVRLEAERRAAEERRLAEEAARIAEQRRRDEERRQEAERQALIAGLQAASAAEIERVLAALSHEHPLVRVTAIQALRRINDPRGLEPLRAALDDADEVVQRAARIALRELGQPE